MEVRNEIFEDYTKYCDHELRNEFGSYPAGMHDPIYLYERYKCRIIDRKPRKVVEAVSFLCPPSYLNAYKNFKANIETGGDLKKYQSRKLKSLDYDDDMLSHWGIQHLHLGNNIETDGFIERTGDLLFVFFTNAHAYIVGIYDHSSWTDLDVIQVIHDNWPYELHTFESNSGNKPTILTSEDHKVLRKKGANATVVVSDGTEYMAPGWGVTCNRAPICAIFNSDRIIFELNEAFDVIKQNIQLILDSDPQRRKNEILTIGFEGLDKANVAIYKIKETSLRFTISS